MWINWKDEWYTPFRLVLFSYRQNSRKLFSLLIYCSQTFWWMNYFMRCLFYSKEDFLDLIHTTHINKNCSNQSYWCYSYVEVPIWSLDSSIAKNGWIWIALAPDEQLNCKKSHLNNCFYYWLAFMNDMLSLLCHTYIKTVDNLPVYHWENSSTNINIHIFIWWTLNIQSNKLQLCQMCITISIIISQ